METAGRLTGRRIILGISGGIAAYRAGELCSLLRRRGATVRVVMTRSATEFIAPLTLETLTQSPVYTKLFSRERAFEMEHISWAKWGEALVIAPATANVLAKMAAGLADDALTTLYLSFRGPVLVAPAMNTRMFEHPATRGNLELLRSRGVLVVGPESGHLACGDEGPGRMAEPAAIVEALEQLWPEVGQAPSAGVAPEPTELAKRDLEGKVVVITSGPTHEYIDPVRFITNPSSGKMGAALARVAIRRGARVHFVTGPVHPTQLPEGCVAIHKVTTAQQMLMAVEALAGEADAFIFAAAVSDFRVDRPVEHKIKRTGNSLSLPLIENPDIAQAIGARKRPWQVTIGFAAETEDLDSHALAKLGRKHLDAIVGNDVSNPRIGFESDDNEVTIYLHDGSKRFVSRRPKEQVAEIVMDVLAELLRKKAAGHASSAPIKNES